jgi:hypothetical protein
MPPPFEISFLDIKFSDEPGSSEIYPFLIVLPVRLFFPLFSPREIALLLPSPGEVT